MDFSLAVWKEYPDAGDMIKMQSGRDIELSRVTQIFNMIVYGSITNSQITFNVTDNDFSSLRDVLCQHEVSETDIKELQAALEVDARPTTKGILDLMFPIGYQR